MHMRAATGHGLTRRDLRVPPFLPRHTRKFQIHYPDPSTNKYMSMSQVIYGPRHAVSPRPRRFLPGADAGAQLGN
jgi:hypothetical protein